MITIKVPCSTSNLGIGFDCLGLALDIYNTFTIEPSKQFEITGCEQRFQNEDNLFIQAYKQTFSTQPIPIAVHFDCQIPVSRGLGSSSTLTIGGLLAGYRMQKKEFNIDELITLATKIEHHPDNVSPCLFGGLCASFMENDKVEVHHLPLSDSYRFTVIVPDYEVSTQQARSVLPDTYSRSILVNSTSRALLLGKAFETGDLDLLIKVTQDEIHTPYRKKLIPDFDWLFERTTSYTPGILLISGSGSTCIFISHDSLPDAFYQEVPKAWMIKEVHPDYNGAMIKEENQEWKKII